MNFWLIAILLILICTLLLESIVSFLNLRALTPDLPKEFEAVYQKDDYSKSQEYTKVTTLFSLTTNTISSLLTILFLILGGFNYIDIYARSFGFEEITTGLIFAGTLGAFSFLLGLPLSMYSTFVIEEQFGFNRTTLRTYVLDTIKSIILAILLGGPILALILWFFINNGSLGWLYCWFGVSLFSALLQFIAPVLIMPLFNKFSPLPEGELRSAILKYAQQVDFQIQGIYTMDGSKRSSKLNAFFTGFGRFRKIVFYDTLVEKLDVQQIVAVLAHEMGHYKLKHIFKMLFSSFIQLGLMFFLLSFFLGNEGLSSAFSMKYTSIYSSLIFFGFLYSPVSLFISIFFNFLSRKHEFEADQYASETTGTSSALIESLKILSQANLSNLTPHPLNVFIHYSHPPVLQRIDKLKCF